jgi:hypothetical protein
MGIFGRSKKEMNNAAAMSISNAPRPVVQPGPTVIHNHAPNHLGDILGGTFAGLIILIAFWFALVFLFDKMGASDPEAEAAFWVVMIPVLFLGGWLLKWVLLAIIDNWRGWDLEIERERSQQVRDKLLAIQTTIEPGRMNESDFEFARVILAVMMTAYGWQESSSKTTFPGKWRPWSMRSTLETANGIGIKLSHERANEVSVWLHKKGVITSPESGQITPAFPDLSNVRVMLDKEFGKPIQVVAPSLRDNRGFRFHE